MAGETQFKTKVYRFLELEGIYPLGIEPQKIKAKPCGYYTKRWAGNRFTKSGLADLQLNVCGLCLDVELKGIGGTPSDLQLYNDAYIKRFGISFVMYPKDFEKFKRFIRYIKRTMTKDYSNLWEKEWE